MAVDPIGIEHHDVDRGNAHHTQGDSSLSQNDQALHPLYPTLR